MGENRIGGCVGRGEGTGQRGILGRVARGKGRAWARIRAEGWWSCAAGLGLCEEQRPSKERPMHSAVAVQGRSAAPCGQGLTDGYRMCRRRALPGSTE